MLVAVSGTVGRHRMPSAGLSPYFFITEGTASNGREYFIKSELFHFSPRALASSEHQQSILALWKTEKNQRHVITSSSSPTASILHIKSKVLESNTETLVPAENCTFELMLSSGSSVIISCIVCFRKETTRKMSGLSYFSAVFNKQHCTSDSSITIAWSRQLAGRAPLSLGHSFAAAIRYQLV